AEREREADGLARARWFALAFGLSSEDRDPASLDAGFVMRLPTGAAITDTMMRGSIDRVDVVERDGIRYGVAVDLKLGSGRQYLTDLYSLAAFQLPIYNGLLRLFGVVPAGVYYRGIRDGVRHGVMSSELAEQFIRRDDRGVKLLSP